MLLGKSSSPNYSQANGRRERFDKLRKPHLRLVHRVRTNLPLPVK